MQYLSLYNSLSFCQNNQSHKKIIPKSLSDINILLFNYFFRDFIIKKYLPIRININYYQYAEIKL